ncbi:MAG: hypothetical protein MJZ17_05165 [Bacteroidales bacterium]|nr:hypothetical protein [Bacteroidales bacterium]
MKAVSLLVNSYLPDDLKDYSQVYDSKSINRILYAVALKHPDLYAKLEKQIGDIGRNASYINGETITLGDLEPVIDRKALYDSMDSEIKALPRDRNFTGKRREIFQKYNNIIEKETAKAGLAKRNNIAMSVLSGARGKNPQFKAMVSTPGTYSDYKGETVDVFSKESFADGIRPAMFCASTNGTRASVVSAKVSTAKGGDWAKQMAAISANQVIREQDCKTGNGISLPIDDTSIVGRKLAKDAGKFKAGEFVTREMLASMANDGVKNVVVRSALTCGTKNGLCAHCIGKYFNGGKLPKIGDSVGLVASTSSSEPVCLVEGTMVRMADGTDKAIQDIKPGDMVLGSDLKGFCRPTRVVNVFHNGPRECYRTKVAKTHTTKSRNAEFVYLESTLAHKVLACNAGVGGIRLKDAVPSIRPVGELPKAKYNRLMLQMQAGWDTDAGVREPMAMLLGMLVGDGSYKGTASGSAAVAVKLSCYDDEQAEELRGELEPMGLLVKEYTAPHEYRIVEDDQYDTSRWTHIDGYGDRDCDKVRNRVRAKLILEGMWGQSCYTKTLPRSIWTWDKESVCKFVGGLIATDGYVSKGVVGYSSNNKALLEDIRKLLESRLGVYSAAIASSTKKRPDGGEYNPTYFFCIGETSSLQALHAQVRIPGRKQALFDRLLESRGPAKSRLAMFRAVEQEYIGTRDTWDIEVDNDTHLFALSNGLIVSNTQMALCLEEHTLVRMADGSAKELKDIEPGEMVLGADKNANTFPVKVLDKFDQGVRSVATYRFSGDDNIDVCITATEDHKILCDGGIHRLSDVVANLGDDFKLEFSPARCLDIEVDHPDHLFVLANGLITSNSAKHTAGMTKDKMTFSGLPVIQQFTQSPEKFKDRATLSEVDGKVDSVEEAPQGGMYVTVSGRRHYVLPGHDVEVKAGDTVEAGDELSEGLADAEDIVRLKGLGAGRKYYADRLSRILEDSGAASDRRNIEIIARGAVNHVRITGNDSVGAYLPDDVVDYNALQATYAAPETSIRTAPSQAVGKYIQEPVLHYSIGTRVTPNVAKDLKDNGYDSVLVDQSAPGFEPELVRLRTASHNNRDWLASQATSYLTQQIEDSVVRGDDTNVMANDDYRPRIAYGRGFAENAGETGRF